MARRKKQDSFLDELLAQPPFLAALFTFFVLGVAPVVWKIIILFVGASIGVIYTLYHLYQIQLLRETGIAEIDKMSGTEFEKRVHLLLQKLGYHVEGTAASGDYGGDHVLTDSNGVRTVVQAKRYSKPVGLTAVQEVVAAKARYHCHLAMVITNQTYTRQAKILAKDNGVELWDRPKLIAEIQRSKKI